MVDNLYLVNYPSHLPAIEAAFQPALPGFYRFQCGVLAVGSGQSNIIHYKIKTIEGNHALFRQMTDFSMNKTSKRP